MNGAIQRHARKCRCRGENRGQKSLHVGGSASVKTLAFRSQGEGIGGPFRLTGRHHIHMAGQDVSAGICRPEAGEEIGAVALGTGKQRYFRAVTIQIIGDPPGDIAIGGSDDRWEADKTLQNFDCVHGCLRRFNVEKLRVAGGVYLLK
ncbi:hypothetical protein D3C86_968770 [compost metagenome]